MLDDGRFGPQALWSSRYDGGLLCFENESVKGTSAFVWSWAPFGMQKGWSLYQGCFIRLVWSLCATSIWLWKQYSWNGENCDAARVFLSEVNWAKNLKKDDIWSVLNGLQPIQSFSQDVLHCLLSYCNSLLPFQNYRHHPLHRGCLVWWSHFHRAEVNTQLRGIVCW